MSIVEIQGLIDDWIADNVHPTGYVEDADTSIAAELAQKCLSELKADHVSLTDKKINEAVGDLTDYMKSAIKQVNDAEVDRQIAKDRS